VHIPPLQGGAADPGPFFNRSLAGPFYSSAALPMNACITSCQHDPECQGFTWKHVDAPAGSGVAVTANCSGKAGQPCCYFQSMQQISGSRLTPLFDCWCKGGLPPLPPSPPPHPPPSRPAWAGPHSCCCTSCTLPPECHGRGGAGVTSECPSMMWRDPRTARRFFKNAHSSGAGAALRWSLEFVATDTTTGAPLRYVALVSANGTILQLDRPAPNGTQVELRQFRYDGLPVQL
jgi:hypothetical protein